MNILILGGSGFVSGMLAERALEKGHGVWTLTRGLRPMRPDVHALTADRHDAEALKKALQGLRFDAALDCICRTAEDAEIDLAVLPAVTDRAVIISTDSVYDPRFKRVPQSEYGVFLRGEGYGADKRRMELTFERYEGPMAWTIFRPGHIYGEGSLTGCYPEETRSRDIPARMRAGEPMRLVGNGKFLLQPVYAGDLAEAMLAAAELDSARNRTFCIGGPDVITNRQYYELLGEILECPVCFENIPLNGYLDSHPEYSGHLCDRVYDLRRLEEAGLPLPKTGLREGLTRQVRWLEAHPAEPDAGKMPAAKKPSAAKTAAKTALAAEAAVKTASAVKKAGKPAAKKPSAAKTAVKTALAAEAAVKTASAVKKAAARKTARKTAGTNRGGSGEKK